MYLFVTALFSTGACFIDCCSILLADAFLARVEFSKDFLLPRGAYGFGDFVDVAGLALPIQKKVLIKNKYIHIVKFLIFIFNAIQVIFCILYCVLQFKQHIQYSFPYRI